MPLLFGRRVPWAQVERLEIGRVQIGQAQRARVERVGRMQGQYSVYLALKVWT